MCYNQEKQTIVVYRKEINMDIITTTTPYNDDKENVINGTLIISPNFGKTLKQAEERFPYASVYLEMTNEFNEWTQMTLTVDELKSLKNGIEKMLKEYES